MCHRDGEYLTGNDILFCSGCAEKYGRDKVNPIPVKKHLSPGKIQIKSEPKEELPLPEDTQEEFTQQPVTI